MTYKTLEDIFFEYQQNMLINEEKLENLQQSDEQYKEISRKIKEVGLNLLQRSLKGEVVKEEELLLLQQQEQEILKRFDLKYNCDKCNDSGFVNGKYCTCLLRKVYVNILGASDISTLKESEQTSDLSLFDNKSNLFGEFTQQSLFLKNQQRILNYTNKFPNVPNIVMLKGKAGLGKSFLLNLLAKSAWEKDIDVMLINSAVLFNLFFKHRMGEATALKFLNNVQLLLIDDLGTEPVTQNVTVEYFFDLLLKRKEKHTVIATNIEDLTKRYDERISSRLNDQKNAILRFLGDDVRLFSGK